MFRHVPFLRSSCIDINDLIDEWRCYKLSVPIFGAIILNSSLTEVLLVQSWSGMDCDF